MANRQGSNGGEFDTSFKDFCQGYLLGLEDNQSNSQQNTDINMGNMDLDMGNMDLDMDNMDHGQAFVDPNALPLDLLGDSLGDGPFCADPALDGGLFFPRPEDVQAGNFLFEQPVNAQLPLTLANPLYTHPAEPAHHQDPLVPLVPAQSHFFTTTATGFIGMHVEDLIIEPSDESCDLALSDAGDENTNHEQDNNWVNEWEAASSQVCQLAYLPTQPQPPPSSPEEHHPIPCSREECHICQVFSLPF